MIAIAGGAGAALCWALTALLAQRSSRLIGGLATFAWSAIAGAILVAVPAGIALGSVSLSGEDVRLFLIAGVANVGGLVLQFVALRSGRVSVIMPIVSAEGAFGAIIAGVLGAPIGLVTGLLLLVVVSGLIIVSRNSADPDAAPDPSGDRRTVVLALTAAIVFAVGLYAQARLSSQVPLGLALAPPTLVGVLLVTIPLAAVGRLPWNPVAVRYACGVAVAELVGFAAYLVGARHSIAIAVVLASQYAAVTVVISRLFFGERLVRMQVVGLVTIAVGVGALALVGTPSAS